MLTYITLLRRTQQGIQNIKESPARLEQAKEAITAAGGERKAFHLTMGQTEQMQAALSRGERITLLGFGTFAGRLRAARTGRNPRTGQEVVIMARKIPTFRAGKRLREAVRQGV